MRDSTFFYCGPAAVPIDVWTRWNFDDPFLLAGLAGLAWIIASGKAVNARAAWAALALMVLIFISPLCALSSALFSARSLHHVILIAGVAPLLAMAFPLRRLPSFALTPLVVLHALILWIWHAPPAYTWGLSSTPAYWLMQGTLLGSAWLLWRGVLAPGTRPAAAVMALVITVAQMGLLAALLVFARVPLYLVHLTSTAAWGLTPIADQQLAGLLMWAPAMLPYLGIGLWLAWGSLRSGQHAS